MEGAERSNIDGRVIPGRQSCAHNGASLLATGRTVPAPSVAAIGAWKGGPRVGGLEIQEARCDRCRRSASNGRGVRRPPRGTWPARRSQEQASRLQLAAVPKIAATRVPQGNPGDPSRSQRALARGPSSRPGRVCWGRRTTGPRVAERRPRTRRTSLRPGGSGRRVPSAGRTARAQTRATNSIHSHSQSGSDGVLD